VFSSLRKFISWLFLKLMFGAFIATSGVAIYALWLFRHDDPDFSAVHARWVANLKESQSAAQLARDNAGKALGVLQQEFAAHQSRAARAAALIEELRSFDTWWEKLFGDREQQRINASRIQALKKTEREARAAANNLRRDLTRDAIAVESCEREVQQIDSQLQLAEETDSRIVYYLNAAWLGSEWFVLAGLCLYFFGPTVRKLVFFYYVAPRIARARALLLTSGQTAVPWLGENRTIVETSLWPGETARVRRRYLLAVDDAVARHPRWLLSRRLPLTSLLSGFVRDLNLHNARAGREYRLAFAHHRNLANEMAVVQVPEGGSLVVRPSFLAGVILPPGRKLGMRRRWQLFRWQSWLTGQLRYLEFTGPCRLVVAGRPGLRAERLATAEEGLRPTCRTIQDKTIAFTPNLEYRLIRTARFWNYYRWNHPLFDAYFVGAGFVLTQAQVPGRKSAFWSATRNRARKILGL
jgi:hypothetical protein